MKTEVEVKKPKAKAKKHPKGYECFTEAGVVYLDLRNATAECQQGVLHGLVDSVGHHTVSQCGHVYDMNVIASHLTQVGESLSNYGIERTDLPYKALFGYIDDYIDEMKQVIASKIKRGLVEFADVPYVFTRGTKIITTHDGEPIAGIIESVDRQNSFFTGPYYNVKISVISNITGSVKDSHYTTKVGYWTGQTKLSKLPIREITDEETLLLTERGRIFKRISDGAHYVYYKGQLARNSWWATQNYRADGRVMLDVSSFQQVDNNQHGNEESASGLDTGDRYERSHVAKVPNLTINEEDLWRTYPFVYGFSFAAKQWGRMAVAGVSDIEWREDAWDKLVLPAEEKELVKAIVEHQDGSFSDIIEGKGGGSIFLLHGPPGQGKTLTAETIAEILHRPLYSISVGELGVSPDELEEKLRVILDVATIWNAVLLLDEADIFLEARDEKDILRNSMTGVFLRLLEYYQGVLFLTTNRVKQIDSAFYSRISIALRFEEADDAKRSKIWENLLRASGLNPDWASELCHIEINGRQIKNVIRLSQTLAKAKNKAVSVDHIKHTLKLTMQFEKDMAPSKN